MLVKKGGNWLIIKKLQQLLIRFRLLLVFDTVISVSQNEFILALDKLVTKSNYLSELSIFDLLMSSDKKYIGTIDGNSFKFRERFNFKNQFSNTAIVKGNYVVDNDQLTIKTQVQGMSVFSLMVIIAFMIFYCLILILLLLELLLPPTHGGFDIAPFLTMTLISLVVILLSYIRCSTNAKAMKEEVSLLYQIIERKQ